MPKRRPIDQRLWGKVLKSGPVPTARPDLGPCWLWLGATTKGYGRIGTGVGKGVAQAHRVAYELEIGPIPEGLTLDHLCVNPPCVNPAHMEPVTDAENIRRGSGWAGLLFRKTHCKYGHEFTEANTFREPDGGRSCLTCKPGRGNGRYRHPSHCVHGHSLSPENLYVSPKGQRQCRACRRAASLRRHVHVPA